MPESHETPVHRVVYYPEIKLLKHVYTADATQISWSDLQDAFQTYAKFLKIHKPKLILVDTSQFKFVLIKEMQDWINTNVIAVLKEIAISKWASVVSPQFFSQVSIEQTMEGNKNYDFETRYFDKESDALDWLLNSHTDEQQVEEVLNS